MSTIASSQPVSSLDRFLSYGLVGLAFLLCFNSLNHVSEYFFLALVGLWFLKVYWQKSVSFIPTPLDVPILVFLGWIAVTLLFALDPAYSLEEWRKMLPRFLIFWFVVQMVRTPWLVKTIVQAFVLGLGVLCLFEIGDFFIVGARAISMESRAGSFFGAHQWLSNYLVIGGPFLWLSWVSQEYIWEKIVNIFVLCVFPLALFLVHTRSAWLVFVIQLSVALLFRMTGKFFLSAGGILLSVMAIFLALHFSVEFQSLLSKNEFSSPSTFAIRINTWKLAIQDIQHSPIVGTGFGKHTFQILHQNLPENIHKHIHNMFLGMAFQSGIPGLILFLFLFLKILSQTRIWLQNSVDPDVFHSHLAMAIGLMTIGLMVRNCFDDMFHGPIVYLFWLLVALGFCQQRSAIKVWSRPGT